MKNIFDGIEEKEIDKILRNLDTKPIIFLKNEIILDNSNKENIVGIILNGVANIEKYDYEGNRFIVEILTDNDIFGSVFSKFTGDIAIVAKEECKVLLFDYDILINKNKNKIFFNNLFELLTFKIKNINMKIDILSKRTIRDKLIKYFLILSDNKTKKVIILPFNYTDLADYLCVDRSSMMREIKKMKDEGIIKTNGKKIKLLINNN